jgi:hypothetical protein
VPIGGILPASGGNLRLARTGRLSIHRVGTIGAPWSPGSATLDGRGRGGRRRTGALEADSVRQDSAQGRDDTRGPPRVGRANPGSYIIVREFVAGAMIAAAPGLKPQGREGNRPA